MLHSTTSITDHAAGVNVGYLNIPGYSRDYLFIFHPCQEKMRRVIRSSKEAKLLNCNWILQWSLKASKLAKWIAETLIT